MNDDLAEFLRWKTAEYNTPAFIVWDPVSIPHRFRRKQDIEIAGFFAAIFAWGNRTAIIGKSRDLLQRMDNRPYEFVRQNSPEKLNRLLGFRHRTFNDTDALYFVAFLHHHYNQFKSLEQAFTQWMQPGDETIEHALNGFYHYFFSLPDAPQRTRKHIATPEKNSICKRLNMFLRWMVRSDTAGVDFGIWKGIQPTQLVCPIDMHVARVARRFGLLQRTQTDWQAALELTRNLRKFDAADPVQYDFALFSLGVAERY